MAGNPKPFRTVEEQIAILESRGVVFSGKEEAARFLLSQNYYSVVNAYKDAFLDKQASNLAGEDRYRNGLPFEALELVYTFDQTLRRRTLHVLLEAETTRKTALVYAFCSYYSGPDDYLDPASYCTKVEFKRPENYTKGFIGLLSKLQGIRENRYHKQYISHYVKQHGCLPLWVAANCLTFGNLSMLFDYQKQKVKTKTCVTLARTLEKRTVKQRELAYSLYTLPDFRNICAHDERLYCAKVGKQGDKGFGELLRALRTVVSDERYRAYLDSVDAMLDEIAAKLPFLEETLLLGMGISRADFAV